jgi:membrane-bound serine protease (ClpP class)
MSDLLIWGLALMLIAGVMLVIEVFVPTAGLLGFAAAITALIGVVCLWRYNEYYGAGGLLTSMIVGPTIAYYGLKLYRHTPLGRKMIGVPDDEVVEAQQREEELRKDAEDALMGKEGIAMTDLRPVGMIQVGDQRLDALAEVVFIQRGSRVRVVGTSTGQVRVRQI